MMKQPLSVTLDGAENSNADALHALHAAYAKATGAPHISRAEIVTTREAEAAIAWGQRELKGARHATA